MFSGIDPKIPFPFVTASDEIFDSEANSMSTAQSLSIYVRLKNESVKVEKYMEKESNKGENAMNDK